MREPDSLLHAAKQVAQIAGLPWSAVQPFYRSLQEPARVEGTAWLPKSVGRNIWYAHPNYVTRLLIALAGVDDPARAHEPVEWATETTPDGRKMYLSEKEAAGITPPIEHEFGRFLLNDAVAGTLDNVEVRPDLRSIVFNMKSHEPLVYRKYYAYREGPTLEPQRFKGIHKRGVIEGLVLNYLAKTINWRQPSDPPFRSGRQDDPAE